MRSPRELEWTTTEELLREVSRLAPAERHLDAWSARSAESSSGASAPSIRTVLESTRTDAQEYVRAVLEYYLWLPGTSSVVSRHDRRCVQALYRRGIALHVVKAAMALAVARRTFRRGDPLPRIRAVHYFLPIVEEVIQFPCDPGYVRYLEDHLRPLAEAKSSGRQATRPSS